MVVRPGVPGQTKTAAEPFIKPAPREASGTIVRTPLARPRRRECTAKELAGLSVCACELDHHIARAVLWACGSGEPELVKVGTASGAVIVRLVSGKYHYDADYACKCTTEQDLIQ